MNNKLKAIFKEYSGYEPLLDVKAGGFSTDKPYNNPDWSLSPWGFVWQVNDDESLSMLLYHRLTNDRHHRFDKNGEKMAFGEFDEDAGEWYTVDKDNNYTVFVSDCEED